MNKIFLSVVLLIFLCSISSLEAYCQEPLWKVAANYEKAGDYSEAIRLKKQMAKDDYGTEWYIDDIAGIARCYSYTNENDSTLYYGKYAIDLAKNLINKSDSLAEEYIQNSAWCFYQSNFYAQAVNAAEMVLSLREKIYGKYSSKYLEWLRVMSYQAFNQNQFDDMVKYCKEEIDGIKDRYGLQSSYYEEAISSIRGYAHALGSKCPDFTLQWIEPYYNIIKENDILPRYQYEFEIILLYDYILTDNLRLADQISHRLQKWCNPQTDIPINDKVRILLKLAEYNSQIGDYIDARIKIEQAWELLGKNNLQPDIAQLIDRHFVERELTYERNTQWMIETAKSIINSNIEDTTILAFFYESLAWAYGYLEDYPKAVYNIKKAIEISPLISRRLKLAQIYMSAKEYNLAQQLYVDLYDEPQVPEPIRRTIKYDLSSLYWLQKDKSKLSSLLTSDFDDMKSEVRRAFAFMNEYEREKYLEKSLLGSFIKFDTYTSYSKGKGQWPDGNRMAYNLALVQKGLLLSTTKDIEAILQNAPDSIQEKKNRYENDRRLYPAFSESNMLRESRIKLMQYVAAQPQFLSQLNYTWEDVKNHLGEHEVAIEFINLWGITPDNLNDGEPSLGALILRNDSDYPTFVKLAQDSTITNLYEFDEEGTKLCELLYSFPVSNQLYRILWEPLQPYLTDVKTVYYAPTGVLQGINLDWIETDDSNVLSDKYNLYRLSSTREICDKRNNNYNNAILYGDIAYSIKGSPLDEFIKSKYRSSTRAGFGPLKGTSTELDSITAELNSRNIEYLDIRKENATEEAFRRLSGHSPNIIHIATHGFYYSRDAIENEYKSGNFNNFIAFQGMNPELYHSGLALSGAQDTWHNESDDVSKYSKMDSSNDGILLSAEIANLDLSGTDLVVLSACETALGNVSSEGVHGLQRAFKLAGVNSLIMSLWKVDDDATRILMTAFYQNYLTGMSKREALLAAQKKVRNTPGFEDPYNWAAFILLDGLY